MTEDRFITTEQMIAISRELQDAGFKHVRCLHSIDPEWRRKYRLNNDRFEEVMWSITLADLSIAMPRVQRLIDICERHGMTFWMSAGNDKTELYFLVATPDSHLPDTVGQLGAGILGFSE